MTGQFSTDTEVMRATAARVTAIHGEMDSRLAILRRQVEALTTELQGKAGTAFQGAMTEFHTTATAFAGFLDQMQTQIRTSSAGSEESDSEGATAIAASMPTTGISRTLG